MSIKWAVGAVAAVVAALFVLPGVVSAHHPEIDGESSCNNDGSWHVDFTVGNSENRPQDLTSFLDSDPEPGVSDPAYPWYVDDGRDMRIEDISATEGTVEDVEAGDIVQNGGDVNGKISNIDNSATETELDVEGYWRYFLNGNVNNQNRREATGETSKTFEAPDFDPCKMDVCTNGDNVTSFIALATPTNDCGIVNVCIGDDVKRVTEYDAEQKGLDEGPCERTPEITTTSTEPEPEVEEPVEEVEEAVAEVSPAVDEVVALPAAGYGDSGVTYTWVAIFAVALLGLGGTTVLMARSRK